MMEINMKDDYDYYEWLDEQDRLYDEERANEEYIAKLEKALDKAIKKITIDNDSGMEFLDKQYEYWKEWVLKEVQEDE